MYVKIHNPKSVKYENKGTCSSLVEYLDKENMERSLGAREDFFDQSRTDVGLGEVIKSIDSNKLGLGKNDSKFFMLTINPSERELQHIARKVSGRDIYSLDQFTAGERRAYDMEVKNYAKVVMDEYAKNFNRGLTGKDLLYFGKLEHERKYGRDNSSLISERQEHIKVSKEDLTNIEFNKYYYADSHCRDVCHGLKQGDSKAIKQAAAEMVKNIPDNAVLVPMPSSVGYATYTKEMCEEIKKLNPTLDVSDVLKCNERQKLYELKKEGKEAGKDFFNFHVNGTLPKDRPVYMVDNVLATGSTYVNAKEVIPDAKLAVYGINEDTQIKLAKIDQLQNLKELNLPKAGDLKPGLQSHVHIIVSRKDITNKIKLSPLAAQKNNMNKMPKGQEEAQVGFDRNKWTETCEQKFDQRFKFQRDLTDSYAFHNTLKNKFTKLTKDFLVPPEYAQTYNYGEKIYHFAKMLDIGKENLDVANYLNKNMHVLNQMVAVSDTLKVQGEALKYEVRDNTPQLNGLPPDQQVRINELNRKIQEAIEGKKEAIAEISKQINTAYSKGDFKELKKLKAKKIEISKPFDKLIKDYTKELDKIISNTLLKSTDKSKINSLESITKLISEKQNAVKPINKKIVEAHKAKKWEEVKSLRSEKVVVETTYNTKISQHMLNDTDRAVFTGLNNKILTLTEEKNAAVKAINIELTKAHENKDVKAIETLTQQKNSLEKPLTEEISKLTKEVDQVISTHITNTYADLNIPLSTEIRHIDPTFYKDISNFQKEFTSLAGEIKDIHSQTNFLANYKELSNGELYKNLENLKESHFRAYGIIEKMNGMEKNLDGIKTNLYKALRTIEHKGKVLDPAIYGKSLESAKKDVLFKIDIVNRAQKDIKFTKGVLYDSARTITHTQLSQNPMNLAKQVLSQIPVGRECMQAAQMLAAPQKALLDLGKKAISALIQAGTGVGE